MCNKWQRVRLYNVTQANYVPEIEGTSPKMLLCLTQRVEEEVLFQSERSKEQKGVACPAKEREDIHYHHRFFSHFCLVQCLRQHRQVKLTYWWNVVSAETLNLPFEGIILHRIEMFRTPFHSFQHFCPYRTPLRSLSSLKLKLSSSKEGEPLPPL